MRGVTTHLLSSGKSQEFIAYQRSHHSIIQLKVCYTLKCCWSNLMTVGCLRIRSDRS